MHREHPCCCAWFYSIFRQFWPLFGRPPLPTIIVQHPQHVPQHGQAPEPHKGSHEGQKQPLPCFKSCCAWGVFRWFCWPSAPTHYHRRQPVTYPYLWLPPPTVTQPQISPMATQRGGTKPLLNLEFLWVFGFSLVMNIIANWCLHIILNKFRDIWFLG